MITEFKLAEITIEVSQKEIKNVHLSVNPPDGRVKVSAPLGMSIDSVRAFALSKLSWIRQEQKKITEQVRVTPREFIDRESHYVWGHRYLLKIIEFEVVPKVELRHENLFATVRPGTPPEKVGELIELWLRDLVRDEAHKLIQKWEPILKVKVRSLFVQKMKTQWGACNSEAGSIRLNTDLARKPLEFLEYIVVHEMVHLIEPSHGARFMSLMDQFFPNWRQYKDELNRLPIPELGLG